MQGLLDKTWTDVCWLCHSSLSTHYNYSVWPLWNKQYSLELLLLSSWNRYLVEWILCRDLHLDSKPTHKTKMNKMLVLIQYKKGCSKNMFMNLAYISSTLADIVQQVNFYICNGCGVPIRDAYSSKHTTLSTLGLHIFDCWNQLFPDWSWFPGVEFWASLCTTMFTSLAFWCFHF